MIRKIDDFWLAVGKENEYIYRIKDTVFDNREEDVTVIFKRETKDMYSITIKEQGTTRRKETNSSVACAHMLSLEFLFLREKNPMIEVIKYFDNEIGRKG